MSKPDESSAESTRGPGPRGQPLPEAFALGKVLDGKYRIEEVVGGGGMGVIVAARHLALDQRVAVKFLRPDLMHDAETVARFAREARAAVRIRSEHVAHVLDVGEAADGTPYMVMELLEGHTMAAELQGRGRLPIEEAVDFVLQLCEALAEAHALGIVHRDLKPENLFLADMAEGWRSLKVLDFGISKAALANDGVLTQTLSMLGSPMYMSPEQIRATRDVDHRSDIWSVGIVLYELLAGRAAYQAGSITQLCVHVLEESPLPLLEAAPQVPPGLAEAVERCLEKDLRERYQNVGELAVDLLPFGPRRAHASVERVVSIVRAARMNRGELSVPGSAPTNGEPSSSAVNVSWSAGPPSAGPRRRRRRSLRPLYAFGAGMCVATLAASVGAIAWQRALRPGAAPALALSAADTPSLVAPPAFAAPAPPDALLAPAAPADPAAPAALAAARPGVGAPRSSGPRARPAAAPRASASAAPLKATPPAPAAPPQAAPPAPAAPDVGF